MNFTLVNSFTPYFKKNIAFWRFIVRSLAKGVAQFYINGVLYRANMGGANYISFLRVGLCILSMPILMMGMWSEFLVRGEVDVKSLLAMPSRCHSYFMII